METVNKMTQNKPEKAQQNSPDGLPEPVSEKILDKNKSNKDETDALADFASVALRRNKPGSYEQLLCNHLIKAVTAQPIDKLRLVSEAAMMVPDFKADNLEIIYCVATSFYSTQYNIHREALMTDPSLSWHGLIAWSFTATEPNFIKFVDPWVQSINGLWKTEKYKPPKPFDEMERWEYCFYVTSHAHNAALEVLQSRFIVWAIPQTMKILEQLTAFVSPDVYAEMLDKVRQ